MLRAATGQTSPQSHRLRLDVSHSTCPPLSFSPSRAQLSTRSCSNKQQLLVGPRLRREEGESCCRVEGFAPLSTLTLLPALAQYFLLHPFRWKETYYRSKRDLLLCGASFWPEVISDQTNNSRTMSPALRRKETYYTRRRQTY